MGPFFLSIEILLLTLNSIFLYCICHPYFISSNTFIYYCSCLYDIYHFFTCCYMILVHAKRRSHIHDKTLNHVHCAHSNNFNLEKFIRRQ